METHGLSMSAVLLHGAASSTSLSNCAKRASEEIDDPLVLTQVDIPWIQCPDACSHILQFSAFQEPCHCADPVVHEKLPLFLASDGSI